MACWEWTFRIDDLEGLWGLEDFPLLHRDFLVYGWGVKVLGVGRE